MKKNETRLHDESWMSECLHLAQQGAGYVSPNPMVGALIVKNGKEIAAGYHKKFGGPHAEVLALRKAEKLSKDATLYVNLEPCCHHGKTPPCTDRIIAAGIKRVVIGMKDPNPLVSGKGISQLRRAGIEVATGVLEKESRRFNEAFIKHMTSGLPFVTLKIAQSLDGYIAGPSRHSRWISNTTSRQIVHALRSSYDAVLVGAGTVAADDPRLNVRSVKGRNPLRIVLDGDLRSPASSRVFKDQDRDRTMLFVTHATFSKKRRTLDKICKGGVNVFALPAPRSNRIELGLLLRVLGDNGIASVLVEGGADIFRQFIAGGYADKMLVFIAPKLLHGGLSPYPKSQRGIDPSTKICKDSHSWNADGDVLFETYF